MLAGLRRCLLGVSAIGLTSTVLLVSDLEQRTGRAARVSRVAVLQHASQSLLDEGVKGILDALSNAGYTDGQNIIFRRFNAENDLATANAIAREITGGHYDMVITASTLSLQVVANANKDGKVKHVFGIVADPSVAGVGVSRANPLDHPPHLVGIGSALPVAPAFRMAQRMNPQLKYVGVAWNPGEPNSEMFTKQARQVCKELGLTLLESTVENTSAVSESANSLVARGAQALWVGGDVTVMVAIDSVVAAARKGRIPVFSIVPPSVKRGGLFDYGANFYAVGKDTGELAVKVLRGADPAKIPIRNYVPEMLLVNKLALRGLKERWLLTDDLVARADVVIDESGIHEKTVTASAPTPTAGGGEGARSSSGRQ